MSDVARRVSASKETSHGWFGSKSGLFQAALRRNADPVGTVLEAHLDGCAPAERALADVGREFAGLLRGDDAVAINRVTIFEARSEPETAGVLDASGLIHSFDAIS